MDYCWLSAMRGRFVLEVHGEAGCFGRRPMRCALALQVINHLQDCAEDCRALDRVYLPLQVLVKHSRDRSKCLRRLPRPHNMRSAIAEVAEYAAALVDEGAALMPCIADVRLSAEMSVIHALARRLARTIAPRDPLSQRVRLSGAEVFGIGGVAATRALGAASSRPVPSGEG